MAGALFLAGLLTGLALAAGIYVLLRGLVAPVPHGHALLINTPQGSRVSFHPRALVPILHRGELIDLRTQALPLRFLGSVGLVCRDSIRADVEASLLVRVNPVPIDILRVAQAIGCERASDPEVLHTLLAGRTSEALATAVCRRDFSEHCADLPNLSSIALESIGRELGGYVIDGLTITRFEQTDIAHLDPYNIQDARGMRRIRQLQEE
ncbi:MAG: putative membrane protein YqiK [Myxococcota bacterium]|jgi:uncharacterized membrane protein YqiK